MTSIIDKPDSTLIPPPSAAFRSRFRPFVGAVGTGLLALLVLVVLWQASISLFQVPSFVAPTPLSVAGALAGDWRKIGAALAYTLTGAGFGLLAALLIALTLAVLFTLSTGAASALMPIVIGMRTAPVLAVAPILILMFGRGQGTTIAVVVIVAFFPIMVNAMKGFRSTKPNALELMHVCGANWLQVFAKVRFPYALPHIFTGMRTAATSALLAAMLAEWLSGAPGIGTLILEASSFRNLPLMWAGVAVSVAIAFCIFSLTVRVEQKLST